MTKMNNSNDARESLLDTISKLKSGRASNLDEVALEIKGFAVLNGLQDRHHEACRINGKTSQKQNGGWGRYEKEMSTAELEAKAKAEALAQEEAAEAKAKDKLKAKRVKLRAAGLTSKASSKQEATAPKRAAKRPVGRPRKARPVGRPKGSKNQPSN